MIPPTSGSATSGSATPGTATSGSATSDPTGDAVRSLLAPLDLGPHRARNRLVFGPHETNLARRRAVSDRHVAYYRRRAAGGCGTIVCETASVHPSDWPYERAPLAADSAEGWAAVAAACHDEGALVVAALGHAGGQGSSAYHQHAMWAPGRVPDVATREVPKAMEPEDISTLVGTFATAAALALDAGADGVELNAGQHSLLRQFLSGLTNQRDDEWGADRSRLVAHVLQSVGKEVRARGGVLGLRLSCDEMAPWAGIVPEAGAELAASFAPLVDYVAVVRGSIFTAWATRPDGHVPAGFNQDLVTGAAQAVRAAAPGTRVVAQGSIVDLAMAESLVAEGRCDMVEMTRAQIAEPDLARLAGTGRAMAARPCVLCNQWCQVRDVRNPIVSCVVEPAAGHELDEPALDLGASPGIVRPKAPAHPGEPELPGEPAHLAGPSAHVPHPVATSDDQAHPEGRPGNPTPQAVQAGDRDEILVVGAGPAGLECARVLATAGRSVVLVDAGPKPGGSLRVAAALPGHERLSLLGDWLVDRCQAAGVDIRSAETVDASRVEQHAGPVVLCTGSLPGEPSFTASPGTVVRATADVVPTASSPDIPNGPVVVWDPIGGPEGVAVAEHLRSRAVRSDPGTTDSHDSHDSGAPRPVTLVTPDMVAGQQLSRTGDLAPANTRLQAAGVTLVRHAVVKQAGGGTASVEDRFSGETIAIPAALVVDAGARLPDDRLWRATGSRLRRAGDAVAPRTVGEAILEGRRVALDLLRGWAATGSTALAWRDGPSRPPEPATTPGPATTAGAGGVTAAGPRGALPQ